METKTVSYEELARRVGSMILANNLPNEVDEDWYNGIIKQPIMRDRLDAIDEETRQDMQKAINEAIDESEKTKLIEELADWEENGERSSVTDSEIYQTYIISERGAEYLFNHTAETISYSEKLQLWFWHVHHWGTAWSHVQTIIVEDIDYDNYVEGTEAMIKYLIG